MFRKLIDLLFPPKCYFCRELLDKDETDLCHTCRREAPVFISEKMSLQYVAQWTAVWYYKGKVRGCIRRFKFWNARGCADFFGRLLAVKLQDWDCLQDIDVITWTPVSILRRLRRGYDQTYLIVKTLCRELGGKPTRTLIRIKHAKPLAGMAVSKAHRAAAIKGAYCAVNKRRFAGKNVLLVDDVLTTGATAEETAKTLAIAGAKNVYFAAIAAVNQNKQPK